MAESMADRLKRIAREKKLAAEAAANVSSPVVSESAGPEVKDSEIAAVSSAAIQTVASVSGSELDTTTETSETKESSEDSELSVISDLLPSSGADVRTTATSTHPLAMQFAEIEQALLTKDPQFKTILRDIHNQLTKDPDLVTAMSEDEIGMIVRGLIVHANTEIVEPAAKKSAKAAVKAASKKTVDVDDL